MYIPRAGLNTSFGYWDSRFQIDPVMVFCFASGKAPCMALTSCEYLSPCGCASRIRIALATICALFVIDFLARWSKKHVQRSLSCQVADKTNNRPPDPLRLPVMLQKPFRIQR